MDHMSLPFVFEEVVREWVEASGFWVREWVLPTLLPKTLREWVFSR